MERDELLLKPIWQMTGEEFLSLLEDNENSYPKTDENTLLQSQFPKYVYGIRGIANLLNSSIATANRLKKSGKIDAAIIQTGRTIIVDVEKALALIKEHSNNKLNTKKA